VPNAFSPNIISQRNREMHGAKKKGYLRKNSGVGRRMNSIKESGKT